MWKRFFIVAFSAGAIAAQPSSGRAQASAPDVEVYAGVTKLYGRVSGNQFDDGGGGGSATVYFNRVVGAEAELAKFNFSPGNVPAFANNYSLLFGPHFAWHGNGWVSPFGHILLGVTRGYVNGLNYSVIGRSAFTVGVGGGVDVKVWRFLWLRPVEIDYLREPFPAIPISLNGVPPPPRGPYSSFLQNNLRLSAGVVVRFGSRRKRGES